MKVLEKSSKLFLLAFSILVAVPSIFSQSCPKSAAAAAIEAAKKGEEQKPAQPAPPPAGPPPYVATVCNPNDGGRPFVALTLKCDKDYLQGGCNRYAKTPGYGPSTTTGYCKEFKTMDEFQAYIKSLLEYQKTTGDFEEREAAIKTPTKKFTETLKKALEKKKLEKEKKKVFPLPRFAGLGGNVVLCKTRAGKTEFAVELPKTAKSCADEDAQKCACGTDDGLADPIACTKFIDDVQKKDYLTKYAQKFGLECKVKTGCIGFRMIVPECTEPYFKTLCTSSNGVVKACGFISDDPKKIGDWAKEYVNKALVTCKVKDTKSSYVRPAHDCDPDCDPCPKESTKQTSCKLKKTVASMAKDIGKKYS